MLKEALGFLADQSQAARGSHVFHPESEPDHVYYVDGQKKHADPKPRAHRVHTIESIVDMAKRSKDASVWYSRHGVTLLMDDETRRDRVHMELAFSPQIKEVIAWGNQSKPFQQAQLILLLRTTFKRSMAQCPKLLDCLRAVRFKTGSEAVQDIGKGKASISRTIEREVSGREDIPDEVFFNVPIFGEPFSSLEGLIDVAIEMDAGTERFTLHPIPGSVERQIALAEQSIGETLAEQLGEGFLVLHGVP